MYTTFFDYIIMK